MTPYRLGRRGVNREMHGKRNDRLPSLSQREHFGLGREPEVLALVHDADVSG